MWIFGPHSCNKTFYNRRNVNYSTVILVVHYTVLIYTQLALFVLLRLS